VSEVIARWRPRRAGPEEAAFARQVVTGCHPSSVSRAKDLLFATCRLASFCTSVGLRLEPEVVLADSTIERFIVCQAATMSAPTRRTLRTNLRSVARAGRPAFGPLPAHLPRERAKAPYGPGEIAGYLARADAQPTAARRQRAGALVCLGAGAGLTPSDLRGLTGADVAVRSGGVVVDVRGPNRRTVPVLARYHERLLRAAASCGGGFLIGGTDLTRRNVTSQLNASIAGGSGLPPLDWGRLRSTWLADVAALVGLRALMDAAGITCSQRLGDVIATLEPPAEADAVRLLGAAR
jgi:integrase